jgi:hypothetical protein
MVMRFGFLHGGSAIIGAQLGDKVSKSSLVCTQGWEAVPTEYGVGFLSCCNLRIHQLFPFQSQSFSALVAALRSG